MKHAALLELRLTHAFYADGRCPDFAIAPTVDTARLLKNHRCLLGASPSGVRVLSALDDATGQPFLPLPAGAALRFHLTLQNDDFPLFTDLTAMNGKPAPLFTNAGLAPGAPGALAVVAGGDARAPGIFADVELLLDAPGAVPASGPLQFEIAFPARQWRWAYYCITDLPPDGIELAIVDAAPAGTLDVLLFSDANRTNLDQQPDPADPLAAELAGRYPGLRCVRMISDVPVPCRDEPRKFLELRHGIDRLSGPLPNPSVRRVSRMGAPTPQDLLVQIVKYRADPFQNP